MTHWGNIFESASYDDSGNYDDGALAAEDIVLHKVKKILSEDATIQSIFGEDGVDVWDTFPDFDYGTLPRLLVYLNSTEEDMAPTRIDDREIRVFIGIRYDIGPGHRPIEKNQASIATMVKHVKLLLKATGNKKLMENLNGVEAQLAVNSGPGVVPWRHILPNAGERQAATLEFDWVYNVHIEHDTGRIVNIQANVT